MSDFGYDCEILVRKVFQCSRSNDPLGRLSRADDWVYVDDEFDIEFLCMAWAVISRIQNEYFCDNGCEEMREKSSEITERIFTSTTNVQLKQIMREIIELVEPLNLSPL